MLSTHEAWSDIRRGTISALGRWRRRHTFLPYPAISWKVAFDFFRDTVGTTHSEILSKNGHRRPKRLFRFLYQRLAGAELHRWETYSKHRVQAKGWDGPTLRRTLRHLPRSVPQPHRWFLLKVHLNAPLPLLLPDWLQRESLRNPYNVVSAPDPLIVLTICHVVLQCSTFTIVSVTLQIFLQSLMVDTASCCKNDGREACWLVFSPSFLPFGQSDRCTGVESISSHSWN